MSRSPHSAGEKCCGRIVFIQAPRPSHRDVIPEKVIHDFIDDNVELIKIHALISFLDAWREVTAKDMKKKWKAGSKANGDFYAGKIDWEEELKSEAVDTHNYAMVPLLIDSLRRHAD